ncbi:MAG: nucleotide excision repair endonuclease [Chitinispirillia bacterium]|nr:nucleotide excision repair endonuclease [Chitinispirillia bacterium]
MNEEIVAYVRKRPEGVLSEVIASEFLKIKNAGKKLAEIAVKAILLKDARVNFTADGLWKPAAGRVKQGETGISELEWVSVYLLTDAHRRSITHISLWTIVPESECICSVWLKNPAELCDEDKELMCDERDEKFSESIAQEAVGQILNNLRGKAALFFSQQQFSLFSLGAQGFGIGLDDYYIMNQLLRAAKEHECRPLTLESASQMLIGEYRSAESAYSKGAQFCRLAAVLIDKLKQKGVESREQLDNTLSQEMKFDFDGKDISLKKIMELPQRAGVYGFMDKAGKYIYIGKAVNLRRRVQSYFRFNSESPQKLSQLRADAHSFTVHTCGSELEALIYEYRLIKKHKPVLNSQGNIAERKGSYKALEDSVIILPHANEDYCMLVWIRKEQKVKMRVISAQINDEEKLQNELKEYFYCKELPASSEDFPELEIVTRWVKRRRDSQLMISVGNLADEGEIVEAIRNLI